MLKSDLLKAGKQLPKNKNLPHDKYHDLILRELDCTVIEYLHQTVREKIEEDEGSGKLTLYKPFDTARGVFTEGGPAFDGAGIQAKSHIQICVRNFNCIKGFFIPRKESKFP